ncbi:DNA ligase D [Novosphingobium cyanobacteriorum]|uniref:DNA ligase (ATP) n=1 Tax=Novosphingobium cyanobacteriorum TaxID=3024215 RepID=A0ABT6CKI3_9SPHN|nr:DNA ligase D [Novosphingobium cyanobacteriorum]MDF8334306.1 DNA ligase D [Novosphingobium cyanobacteriorum]
MAKRKDPLEAYNARRDFARTAEPEGKVAQGSGNRFIVQKHDATRLHWDFRLEVDGVLKSWAVTRGPSPDPDDKRLAVHTEDHPLSYADFEGTIPEGEYGGGTVMLWDRGTWAPVPGKSAKDLAKGHLHFTLEGERMKGEWIILRLKPRPREKRENWLLRKVDDAFAEEGDKLVERGLTSVLTGRTMAEIAGDKQGAHSLKGKKGKAFAAEMDQAAKRNAKPARKPVRKQANAGLPAFRPPQLATLVDAVPAGNGWMHEIKFDGYRALVAVNGADVRVYTRNGLDWTDKFGPLVQAIAALDLPPALIDGEIVAYDKEGNPDFSSLQKVLKRGHGAQTDRTPLEFFAFDLLEVDGEDLADRPNIERKERLEGLMAGVQPPLHVAQHVVGSGEKLFQAMCAAGQEGIIAKRIDAPYRGARGRSWVKVKCILRQEFVIIGWKKSSAKGRPFSSLLLAQNEGGRLVYKGNVGTGFGGGLLEDLAKAMKPLAVDEAAAEVPREHGRGVTWLEPKLVAEIAFAEFTAEGSVRHASFVGLRNDKKAADVVPERAEPIAEVAAVEQVKISNRDRVIFPESGETKGDLADWYTQVAPLMLPFAAGRPISLVRCPQGRGKKCFFQKHDSGTFGPSVHHVPIAEKDGNAEEYIFVDDTAGLLSCVQMGTIEFHGWGSMAGDVEAPNRMVFDLDPDEGLGFAEVKKAAHFIHDRLADIGLASFPMLSGGKGVHVVVPLTPGHTWEAHKDFARRFAEALSMAEPDRFVANMSKAKRVGRIFIDYLRNQRGATAVLPYSARARAAAPVAVPITWGELDGFEDAHPFSIRDADQVLRRAKGKGLAGWGFAEQRLPEV